jgi:hypothetical protein
VAVVLQNDRSQLFNTAAHTLGGACGCSASHGLPPTCGGNKTALYAGPACRNATARACDLAALQLQDPTNFDFRPKASSPLVDAGAVVSPYTDGFHGSAPDIGAYEHGAPNWRAGCQGLEGC